MILLIVVPFGIRVYHSSLGNVSIVNDKEHMLYKRHTYIESSRFYKQSEYSRKYEQQKSPSSLSFIMEQNSDAVELLVNHRYPEKYFIYSEYKIIPSKYNNSVSYEPALLSTLGSSSRSDNNSTRELTRQIKPSYNSDSRAHSGADSNSDAQAGIITLDTESSGDSYLSVGVNSPASWEQGSTLTLVVTITSNCLYPYLFTGELVGQVEDVYKYPNNNGFYIKNEANTTKNIALLNNPRATFYLHLSIGFTTIGLKSVSVILRGQLHYMNRVYTVDKETNLGYNFVQKYSKPLFAAKAFDSEDYFENPVGNVGGTTYLIAYGYDSWTIIRKAGEAVDASIESDASALHPYDTGRRLTFWVHDHFVYDNQDINEGAQEFYYIDPQYTASALWILTHPYNGYYRGVCDEYTVVLIALARALNIPAHFILAYISEGQSANGHAFAELWDGLGNRWVHADPTWREYDNPSVYEKIYVLEIIQNPNDARLSYPDDVYGANGEGISWDYCFIKAGPSTKTNDLFPHGNPWLNYRLPEGEFDYAALYPNGHDYFNTYPVVGG